ncbi:MAG: hypothetical protein HN348_20560 [Proteobacteria bacterium]|jgi:hypothetical protein|nr:hypothetical protein [Pseudomonadota bacterium]
MRLFIWSSLVVFSACNREPTPEMEEGLTAVNDAIGASLVTAEAARYVTSARRDGTCPTVTQTGDITALTVAVDYGVEGCVPVDGLVPYAMAGGVALTLATNELSVGFNQLTCDGNAVDGAITGGVSGLSIADGVEISLVSDLDIDWVDWPVALEEDFTASINFGAATLDGEGEVINPDGTFGLDVNEVKFKYEDILAACPLPSSGDIVVTVNGEEITIKFDNKSPNSGEVNVQQGKKKAKNVPLCDYLEYL